MKIRKCVVALIFTAVLISVTLLNSFAADLPLINTPLVEPDIYLENGSSVKVKAYFCGQYETGNFLYVWEGVFPSGTSLGLNLRNQNQAFILSDQPIVSSSCASFDLNTGNFLQTESSFLDLGYGFQGTSFSHAYSWRFGYFPAHSVYDSGFYGGYFVYPDGVTTVGSLASLTSNHFVNWSAAPSEHNTYHSELSEPVADEYNSYFICNDRLYWLSYRANGLYSFIQNFELSSQVAQEDISYSSSGQGTYAGQANGFTVEPVSISDGSFAGVGTGGTPVVGVYSGFNLGQISYVGVNTGNLRVNSSGQMTYNDLEVYPVSVNSQFLNRLFDIIVYLTDDTGFKIWLVPRSDLGQNLVLDASLYCSCFDLTNGDYISSSFSSYTGNYQYAGFDYPLEDKIESVRCYGCAFYNVNNIPVHLSDVFWGYDLEFKEWRDNMLQKLTQIYNLLNHSDSIPETTTSSFGSSVEGLSDPSYSDVSPEQVGNELNNAWDQNPDIVNNSGFVKGWISDFSIPKLIALCVLALASGTVILTLGKNKADS